MTIPDPRTTSLPSREEERKVLERAFRYIENIAADIIGVPNEAQTEAADDLAGDIVEVLDVPLDECWPAHAADAILARLTPVVDDGWRGIESAPKDGTRLLAWWPKAGDVGLIGIAEWVAPNRSTVPHWTWDGSWSPGIEPTHWMPLPAAPSPEREEAGRG